MGKGMTGPCVEVPIVHSFPGVPLPSPGPSGPSGPSDSCSFRLGNGPAAGHCHLGLTTILTP